MHLLRLDATTDSATSADPRCNTTSESNNLMTTRLEGELQIEQHKSLVNPHGARKLGQRWCVPYARFPPVLHHLSTSHSPRKQSTPALHQLRVAQQHGNCSNGVYSHDSNRSGQTCSPEQGTANALGALYSPQIQSRRETWVRMCLVYS